jgi:hypothetical protein
VDGYLYIFIHHQNNKGERMNRKILGIIGIVLVILTITFFILWNVYLDEKISTVEIITLTQDAHKNDPITSNMITTKRLDRHSIAVGALLPKDVDRLIGQCASQTIPAGVQLFDVYFQPSTMTLNDDEQLVSIPSDWILAVPQSLRRGDSVFFYAFATEDAHILSILEKKQAEQTLLQTELDVKDENRLPSTSTETITIDGNALPTNLVTIPISPEDTQNITVMKDDILRTIVEGKDYQIQTTVFYVKDSQNREIMTVYDNTSLSDARLNGTGIIGEIEINVTEQQLDALQTAISLGYQFIVMTK